jgi:hypothetical protein
MGAGTTQWEEDGDAALESYMSNMMQRVCGDSATGKKGPLHECVPVVAAQRQEDTKEAVATEAVRSIERESVPRTSKNLDPEVDITAMRELANHSADQAIATHRQRHQTHATFSKLVYGGIAMSVALLLILQADHYGDPAFLGGSLAAMAGFYWAIQLCVALLRSIRVGSEVEMRVDKIVAPEEQEDGEKVESGEQTAEESSWDSRGLES